MPGDCLNLMQHRMTLVHRCTIGKQDGNGMTWWKDVAFCDLRTSANRLLQIAVFLHHVLDQIKYVCCNYARFNEFESCVFEFICVFTTFQRPNERKESPLMTRQFSFLLPHGKPPFRCTQRTQKVCKNR